MRDQCLRSSVRETEISGTLLRDNACSLPECFFYLFIFSTSCVCVHENVSCGSETDLVGVGSPFPTLCPGDGGEETRIGSCFLKLWKYVDLEYRREHS